MRDIRDMRDISLTWTRGAARSTTIVEPSVGSTVSPAFHPIHQPLDLVRRVSPRAPALALGTAYGPQMGGAAPGGGREPKPGDHGANQT